MNLLLNQGKLGTSIGKRKVSWKPHHFIGRIRFHQGINHCPITRAGSIWSKERQNPLSLLLSSNSNGADTISEEERPSVTLFLTASSLRQSLLLKSLPEGRGQAIVVVGVLEESEADKAGVVPGQKLLAISDPIRPGEMWSLGNSPSLRFVRDAINAMRNKEVCLKFTEAAIYTNEAGASNDAELMTDDEGGMRLVSSISTVSVGVSGRANEPGTVATIGDGLTQRYDSARKQQRQISDVQKRIDKRREYMNEVSQRNDSNFLAWTAALFLGPSLGILALAYFSGYLDSMYTNSLSAFK